MESLKDGFDYDYGKDPNKTHNGNLVVAYERDTQNECPVFLCSLYYDS